MRQRHKPGVQSSEWLDCSRGDDVDEIIFIVEEAAEGGFTAHALEASIFTEAGDLQSLGVQARDAVLCHYGDRADRPRMIRLHYTRDDLIAV
jgi:hypothetical protein